MGTEEEYTLNIVKLPIMNIITNFDYTPPVYNLLAHFSYLLFNGYDVAIRYPAVLAGILLIPAMYYIGLQYKDEIVGLYCAGITAILVPMIYYSQYARAYSLSLLCFVIALILYLRLKNNDDPKIRVLLWIMVVVNLYVHLFTLIPLSLMCLDLLFSKKHWLCGIGAGICSLPLIGMLVNVLSTRNGSGFNYGASPLQMVFLTFPEFFNTVFLNVLVLAGVGAWLYKNKVNKILIAITAVTLIVGVVGASITPMFPRYLMSAAIAILLFACVGIVELTTMLNKKVGVDLTYVVMIGIFVVFIWMMWPNLESHYFVMQYVC
jgi:uncharacterized membrane protein